MVLFRRSALFAFCILELNLTRGYNRLMKAAFAARLREKTVRRPDVGPIDGTIREDKASSVVR
jgi:hypothetical protein